MVVTNSDESHVADCILQYLAEHPHAMETLDGIADWWVMRQQVRVNLTTLARVLRRLTAEGVLEEIGDGAPTRYRLRT